MKYRHYPVSKDEIATAAIRQDNCTIYVRSDLQLPDGRVVPIGAFGSPMAYRYIQHNGETYAVGRHWATLLNDGTIVSAE